MDEEKKTKKPLFDRQEMKWFFVVVFYLLMMNVMRIDTIGTALIIFGYLAGRGIESHGLKLIEVHQ